MKFISILLVSLLTMAANADYPTKTLYTCKLFGEDLDGVSAKAEIKVVDIRSSHEPNIYLKLSYSSSFDRIEGLMHSVPVLVVNKKNSRVNELRFSDSKTYEGHRFTRWDDLYLIINLKKQESVMIDGEQFTGYVAEAGFKTGYRYHQTDALCKK